MSKILGTRYLVSEIAVLSQPSRFSSLLFLNIYGMGWLWPKQVSWPSVGSVYYQYQFPGAGFLRCFTNDSMRNIRAVKGSSQHRLTFSEQEQHCIDWPLRRRACISTRSLDLLVLPEYYSNSAADTRYWHRLGAYRCELGLVISVSW
jgi:hypothetical protein